AYPGFVLDDRPAAPALFDRAHAVPGLDFLPGVIVESLGGVRRFRRLQRILPVQVEWSDAVHLHRGRLRGLAKDGCAPREEGIAARPQTLQPGPIEVRPRAQADVARKNGEVFINR